MEEIIKLIRPELLALMPLLYAAGMIVKRIEKIPDWCIPLVLLVTGILASVGYVLAQAGGGVTAAEIIGALIQGVLLAVATVGTNQFVKQIAVKRVDDKEQDAVKPATSADDEGKPQE